MIEEIENLISDKKPLATGSSRTVYHGKNNNIIKYANTEKGIFANKTEKELLTSLSHLSIIPKLIDSDSSDNPIWLSLEYIKQPLSQHDFIEFFISPSFIFDYCYQGIKDNETSEIIDIGVHTISHLVKVQHHIPKNYTLLKKYMFWHDSFDSTAELLKQFKIDENDVINQLNSLINKKFNLLNEMKTILNTIHQKYNILYFDFNLDNFRIYNNTPKIIDLGLYNNTNQF